MELNRILTNISGSAAGLPEIERHVRAAKKEFRPFNPTDVDKLTFLAVSLWLVGDGKSAVEVLSFLDKQVDTSEGYLDVVSSLAVSRLLLAEILAEKGENDRVAQLMLSDDISASYNFDTFENPVRETVQYRLEDLDYFEKKPESKQTEVLQASYHGVLDTTILLRRFDEVEHKTSEEDRQYLLDANARFKERLRHCLVLEK